MRSSNPAKALRLDADRDAHLGMLCPIPVEDLQPILMSLKTRHQRATRKGRKLSKPLREPIAKLKRAIAMAAPRKPQSSPVDVEPSKGRRSPLTDPSNVGNWGQVDKEATFAALSRIVAVADPTVTEIPRVSPINLAILIEQLSGVRSDSDGWDEAFENAPSFRDVPEPVLMAIKRRPLREATVTRKTRRLRGAPAILMSLAPANQAVAGDKKDADPKWGDIDAESLFKAITALIKRAGSDIDFPVCEPKDLARNLKEVADKLERSRQSQPLQMGLRRKPRATSRGFTEADRAAARRLRGIKPRGK